MFNAHLPKSVPSNMHMLYVRACVYIYTYICTYTYIHTHTYGLQSGMFALTRFQYTLACH